MFKSALTVQMIATSMLHVRIKMALTSVCAILVTLAMAGTVRVSICKWGLNHERAECWGGLCMLHVKTKIALISVSTILIALAMTGIDVSVSMQIRIEPWKGRVLRRCYEHAVCQNQHGTYIRVCNNGCLDNAKNLVKVNKQISYGPWTCWLLRRGYNHKHAESLGGN